MYESISYHYIGGTTESEPAESNHRHTGYKPAAPTTELCSGFAIHTCRYTNRMEVSRFSLILLFTSATLFKKSHSYPRSTQTVLRHLHLSSLIKESFDFSIQLPGILPGNHTYLICGVYLNRTVFFIHLVQFTLLHIKS